MFDFQHPFFKPLWVRIMTCAVLFAWGSFEYYTQAPMWGTLFCTLGVVATYQFFLAPKN